MQQVNLYQPILRKQEKVFSAKTLLQGNLLVLAGVLLLAVYTIVQSGNIQEQLTQVKQEHEQKLKQLKVLSDQYPVKVKDESLPALIEQAKAELNHKQQLLAAVQQLGLDEESGFSSHMAGLSRQYRPELWLHEITLKSGKQMELIGSSYQAEEVARYLQRLSNEKPFRGTAFQSVTIARDEDDNSFVDFTLSTTAAKGGDKP